MDESIIGKLQAELTHGVKSECQVVYILVEIRKLLDRWEGRYVSFDSLRLYCNWVVHVELSHRQAQRIVQMADSLYPKLVAGTLTQAEKDDARRIFSLTTFREQLGDFLDDNGLPLFDDPAWNIFAANFLNVIEDCPLICKAENMNLAEVDQVELIKEVDDSHEVIERRTDGGIPLMIWGLSFKGKFKRLIGRNFNFVGN